MAIYELGNSSGNGVISLPIEISDVNQLETTLNNKAPLVHRHTIADIDNLQTELTRIELIANGITPPSPVPTKGTVGPAGVITFNVGSESPPDVELDFLTLLQCSNYIRDSNEINKGTAGYEHFETIIIRACKLTEPIGGDSHNTLHMLGKALTTDTGLDLLNTTIIIDGYVIYSGTHHINSYAIDITHAHTVKIIDFHISGGSTGTSGIEIRGHSLTRKTKVIASDISSTGRLTMDFSYVDLTTSGHILLSKLRVWNSTVTNDGNIDIVSDNVDPRITTFLTLSGSDMTITGTLNILYDGAGALSLVGILMEDTPQVTGCNYTGGGNIGIDRYILSLFTGIVVNSRNTTITGGISPANNIVINAYIGIKINAYPCSIANMTIRTNGVQGYAVSANNSFTGRNISIIDFLLPYKIVHAGPGTTHFELYDNVTDVGTIGDYSMEIATVNGEIYEPIITGAPMSKPYIYY